VLLEDKAGGGAAQVTVRLYVFVPGSVARFALVRTHPYLARATSQHTHTQETGS
jgi:hypothetical protein